MHDDLVPPMPWIHGWIEEIFRQGLRRPGSPADLRVEELALGCFRELGLDRVRGEPVRVPKGAPLRGSLRIRAGNRAFEVECLPLPFSAPTEGLVLELVPFDPEHPEAVAGHASLAVEPLLRVPALFPVAGAGALATLIETSGPELHTGGRLHDPSGSLTHTTQVLPFGPRFQQVMEPSIRAGARAFVGVLEGYPGDSCRYYVPYDGIFREIPGVWIRGSDGARLQELCEAGPVEMELASEVERGEVECRNIVGELDGPGEDLVVIGSHHDGPWASAVEDASGVALVLAQAAYWSRIPAAERPHRMLFLLNAAHMAGGAGCRAFLEAHAGELDRIVLEVHLEHAAREFREGAQGLEPTGEPEPRWWFTSRIPLLEAAVAEALSAEELGRSLILPPDAFGSHPTTDGGFFHLHGVPLVNFLTAPFYLFDEMDRMDKVDADSLVPVTRAAIRILEATRGVPAAEMRG